MEYHDNWLLKSSCFQFFGDGKYGLFLSQNVNGNMIFTDHWKVLVLNFSEMGNTVFFEPKSWLKYKIYWLQESSCFELFGDSKYGLFWAKKLMERWYLPGLLSFPWYSRTWEIWFSVQWSLITIANKSGDDNDERKLVFKPFKM